MGDGIAAEMSRLGNEALLSEPLRVALVPALKFSRDDCTAAVCDAIADAFARRDVCMVTLTEGLVYRAVGTAAVRQAGSLILIGSQPLRPLGDGRFLQPIQAARVWDEAFDPKLMLYTWGEGLLTVLRAVATHVVAVDERLMARWRGSEAYTEEFLRLHRPKPFREPEFGGLFAEIGR